MVEDVKLTRYFEVKVDGSVVEQFKTRKEAERLRLRLSTQGKQAHVDSALKKSIHEKAYWVVENKLFGVLSQISRNRHNFKVYVWRSRDGHRKPLLFTDPMQAEEYRRPLSGDRVRQAVSSEIKEVLN